MSESRFVTEDELIEALKKVGESHDALAVKQRDLGEVVADLGGSLKKVSGRVGELTDHRVELGRARWCWRTLSAGPRRTALWKEVLDFVTWYNARYGYSAESTAVWPCWPKHPVVVEEMTALMVAYEAAYAGEDATDAIIAWHDRWLWPAIERIHSRPGGMKSCSAAHHDLRHTVDPGEVWPEEFAEAISADVRWISQVPAQVEDDSAAPEQVPTQVPGEFADDIPLGDEPVGEGQW